MQFDPTFGPAGQPSEADQRSEEIELVGPHLRLGGRLVVSHFNRLSDFVNLTRGYILLHDARLLRRNGEPTNLVVDELMVNQDEITFIGQSAGAERSAPVESTPLSGYDRPTLEREPRRFVILTPGHSITGTVHVYREMSLQTFVDTTDPRFVTMTKVTARSLADRRVISHFDLLLVNRTQMTAAAEAGKAGSISD